MKKKLPCMIAVAVHVACFALVDPPKTDDFSPILKVPAGVTPP